MNPKQQKRWDHHRSRGKIRGPKSLAIWCRGEIELEEDRDWAMGMIATTINQQSWMQSIRLNGRPINWSARNAARRTMVAARKRDWDAMLKALSELETASGCSPSKAQRDAALDAALAVSDTLASA